MDFMHQRNRRCSSSSSFAHLPLFLVFFLTIFLEKSVGVVTKDEQDSSLTLENIQKYLAKINKPAVLSIESPDGDIIDCVDKWKQPAFDHPLLKNHKLQMVPPELPSRKKNKEMGEISSGWGTQLWHQNGTRCPKGTVPIRRTKVEDVLRAGSLQNFWRKYPRKHPSFNVTVDDDDDPATHEYAILTADPEYVMYGASAVINVWKPFTEDNEMSLAQIWLRAGRDEQLNTMECGWQVYPEKYLDGEPRLFIYWTVDGYRATGCYNLECPGFVLVDASIALGASVLSTSTRGDILGQATFDLKIFNDEADRNWWVVYNGVRLGYWPSTMFTVINENVDQVQWGGEIVNLRNQGSHTTTQMGSGLFPATRYSQAAFFRELKVDDGNEDQTPEDFFEQVDYPPCYGLIYGVPDGEDDDSWGLYFYFGGPGGGTSDCI